MITANPTIAASFSGITSLEQVQELVESQRTTVKETTLDETGKMEMQFTEPLVVISPEELAQKMSSVVVQENA
jgi:hypothetical protein